MSTVLVTGGAGFIGSSLVRALLDQSARVVVLDNFVTGRRENLEGLGSQVEVVEGDIRRSDDLARCMRGVDYVFHQAALASVPRSMADPVTTNEVNVTGTLEVLRAAHRASVKRVVLASSSSVYGETEELPKVEAMPHRPVSPYAVSKAAGELYAQTFDRAFGLSTVCLRYFNVFGPRQDPNSEYAAVVPKFIARLLAGEPPTIFGDGLQTRDFCYVDNVVRANLQAALAPAASGRVYNVAVGTRVTLLELVAMLNRVVGTSLSPVLAAERPGDIRHSLAAVDAARQDLGYEPSVTLEQGLARTVQWYRAQPTTA
jgi:UDP-glucose 4-epimerase